MWTSISLNCHQVWDQVMWSATAIWVQDDVSEPIVLTKSGVVPVGDNEQPATLLKAAVAALEREQADMLLR